MDVRKDFPMLQNNPQLIYFDNACTTLKPKSVVDAERRYYEEYCGCAGRSNHKIGKRTEDSFEDARKKIAAFVGAETIVFTKNASEALNLVIQKTSFAKRNRVVSTVLEHHSALLPLLVKRDKKELELAIVEPSKQGVFDAESFKARVNKQTALVVVHAQSNSLGTRPPLKEIVGIARDAGARVLVDGAQSVPHSSTNLKALGADFIAFSGHKMLGPTGIGCLAASRDAVESLDYPFLAGGETIEAVSLEKIVWAKPPQRFEAGIQNYAGAIGLAAACDYLTVKDIHKVEAHDKALASRIAQGLRAIEGVALYGPQTPESGVVTFNVGKASPHEIALFVERGCGAALRSGVFCAEPGMKFLGVPKGAVRASLYLYNTEDECDAFVASVAKAAAIMA
ncbi:hypothetical protein AUJ14_03930 [Candidatus Micrarchaeota archaeon CG1_02_55_22]|nr:MAG: hypothetical protein AUJ14_03930 [Candidatus Micrarchaeota archaeon CG1_02_55_22]